MANKKDSTQQEFSLLHPMAMGGIHGGDGYTFQDRYIVCHIAKWIADKAFLRIMPEATGDVDVVFSGDIGFVYEHIQVKDHTVNKAEFKEVLDSFVVINTGTGNVYRKFVLACPSVSGDIKSLAAAVERFREASALYADSDDGALKTTLDAVQAKIDSLNVGDHSAFILDKLHFEIGMFDFNDNSTCKRMFVATLVENERYKEYLHHYVSPAYSVMIEQVLAHRGKVLDKDKIDSFLAAALQPPKEISEDNVLHIHNWTVEKYEPAASVELDWSKHFDRPSRTVPTPEIWNNELFPELYKVRQEIAKKTVNRHIVFRGKCTLTTGIVLGTIFPEIGNWSFELPQPPQVNPWRSDAERIKKFKCNHEIIDPSSLGLTLGGDVALVFNITGTAMGDVVDFLKSSGITLNKLIAIKPGKLPGSTSIESDAEAVSLASAAKDLLQQAKAKNGAGKTHLFYFGPISLAVFLGQKLTSLGHIQLYEYQDPGYRASCLIKT